MKRLAFAVPGDLTTLTGGYIYDRRVMAELRVQGWTVDHIALPGSFPDPDATDMRTALQQLSEVDPEIPLIVDGLAFGALDPDGVAELQAPPVALVHHPLAKESGVDPERRSHLLRTERSNLAKVAHVIVPSPHTAEILTADYGVAKANITIACPGIDRPDQPSHPTDPPLILSVGIQLPRKGHDILLKALAQVTDLPWRAVIAGAALDADHGRDLNELCETLGLTERVTLAGQVSREDLLRLYREATLFALATRYEGYGIVFDEALVHGLPILSCLTGAVSDTVPANAGHLVPPEDPETFAQALRHLLTDHAARASCADASYAVGRTRPGWADTARTFAEALEPLTVTRTR